MSSSADAAEQEVIVLVLGHRHVLEALGRFPDGLDERVGAASAGPTSRPRASDPGRVRASGRTHISTSTPIVEAVLDGIVRAPRSASG